MANIQTYSLACQGNVQLSANFTVQEFASHDGYDTVLIDPDLISLLQKIRDIIGVPIIVTSGYRTVSHNASVGGAQGSLHTLGRAADFIASGKSTLELAACAENVGAPGILRYVTDNFVHIDTREKRGYYNVINGEFSPVESFGGTESATTIAAIQVHLNEVYNIGLRVDGIFGPISKRGLIKGLQTELNKQFNAELALDGYWGPATRAACPRVNGGTGEIQYIIQAALFCFAGYAALPVNGCYDDNTSAVVRSFQTRNGLKITGIMDQQTFASLFG